MSTFFIVSGLSSPPLGPHNNNYNREDNCIEAASESSAMPIFIFMVAQVLDMTIFVLFSMTSRIIKENTFLTLKFILKNYYFIRTEEVDIKGNMSECFVLRFNCMRNFVNESIFLQYQI